MPMVESFRAGRERDLLGHRLCWTVVIVWYCLDDVNRRDSRLGRPPDLDVVSRPRPHRARRSVDAIRAQAPRGGDDRQFLVLPPCPALQGAAAPRRAGPADGRARGGWAAAAA